MESAKPVGTCFQYITDPYSASGLFECGKSEREYLDFRIRSDSVSVILPECPIHLFLRGVSLMSDPVCLLERAKCFLMQGGNDGCSECLVRFLVQEDELIAFLKIFVVEQPPSGCFFSGEYLLCEIRGEFEGFYGHNVSIPLHRLYTGYAE